MENENKRNSIKSIHYKDGAILSRVKVKEKRISTQLDEDRDQIRLFPKFELMLTRNLQNKVTEADSPNYSHILTTLEKS